MEKTSTYNADLAHRVAALSSTSGHCEPDANGGSGGQAVLRVAVAGLSVALCVVIGWGILKAPDAAPEISVSKSIALTQGTPLPLPASDGLLGTALLVPQVELIFTAASPLDLIDLAPGTIVAEGQKILPEAPPLPFRAKILARDMAHQNLHVMPEDRFMLVLPVAETEISRVTLGDTADVEFDAFPDRRFTAKIVAIGPMVAQGRGTVDVSLQLNSNDPQFRANMSARVRLCGCPKNPDPFETQVTP